jgi:hypothetical protein
LPVVVVQVAVILSVGLVAMRRNKEQSRRRILDAYNS